MLLCAILTLYSCGAVVVVMVVAFEGCSLVEQTIGQAMKPTMVKPWGNPWKKRARWNGPWYIQSHEILMFSVKTPWRLREPWSRSCCTNEHAMTCSTVLDAPGVDIASMAQPTLVFASLVNALATHGTFYGMCHDISPGWPHGTCTMKLSMVQNHPWNMPW